jgi:hypothetical protein
MLWQCPRDGSFIFAPIRFCYSAAALRRFEAAFRAANRCNRCLAPATPAARVGRRACQMVPSTAAACARVTEPEACRREAAAEQSGAAAPAVAVSAIHPVEAVAPAEIRVTLVSVVDREAATLRAVCAATRLTNNRSRPTTQRSARRSATVTTLFIRACVVRWPAVVFRTTRVNQATVKGHRSRKRVGIASKMPTLPVHRSYPPAKATEVPVQRELSG